MKDTADILIAKKLQAQEDRIAELEWEARPVLELAERIAELQAENKMANLRINELEAALAASCDDMRSEFLGQCPAALNLQAKLDAVESDLSNLHDDLHEYGGQRWTPQVINILEALAGEAK